jgi:hypothetical protein
MEAKTGGTEAITPAMPRRFANWRRVKLIGK